MSESPAKSSSHARSRVHLAADRRPFRDGRAGRASHLRPNRRPLDASPGVPSRTGGRRRIHFAGLDCRGRAGSRGSDADRQPGLPGTPAPRIRRRPHPGRLCPADRPHAPAPLLGLGQPVPRPGGGTVRRARDRRRRPVPGAGLGAGGDLSRPPRFQRTRRRGPARHHLERLRAGSRTGPQEVGAAMRFSGLGGAGRGRAECNEGPGPGRHRPYRRSPTGCVTAGAGPDPDAEAETAFRA